MCKNIVESYVSYRLFFIYMFYTYSKDRSYIETASREQNIKLLETDKTDYLLWYSTCLLLWTN